MVLDAIKDLEPERKCWRTVGGVLVERSIKEVIPALEDRIKNQLSPKIESFDQKLKMKQNEVDALEKKFNIASKKEELETITEENEKKGGVGVLA